jgi:hypothetical protein
LILENEEARVLAINGQRILIQKQDTKEFLWLDVDNLDKKLGIETTEVVVVFSYTPTDEPHLIGWCESESLD